MPVNLQLYTRTVGAFNNSLNHNNINSSVFHRKPNVSSIAIADFTILINFCTFLLTIILLATKILFIYMLSTYLFHVWLFLIRAK